MNANQLIRTAVVTGGHPYDVAGFHQLFRRLEGIDAYIQHRDEFATSSVAERGSYDVILFYTMLLDDPQDDGPFYQGKPKSALEQLDQSEQGIFILHHSLLAYPEWPVWNRWVGFPDISIDWVLNQIEVTPPESLTVQVASPEHPITQGLTEWEMLDEIYLMDDPAPESQILLTTNHPKSMRALAWTRPHPTHRILCWQSGHDNQTWTNPHFLTFLRQGLQWCASRI